MRRCNWGTSTEDDGARLCSIVGTDEGGANRIIAVQEDGANRIVGVDQDTANKL